MKTGQRNHGYGRRLDYAGRQVLRERFGDGHFASQRTQSERWSRFSAWMRSDLGIGDMRDIEPAHVRAYADSRLEDGIAPKTVANEISAANVVMTHATRGRWDAISPRSVVGPLSSVRTEAPITLAHEADQGARDALSDQPRAAATYAFARAFGMRAREASLANINRLVKEARELGKINVQEGAKGGRDAPRWVPVSERGRVALDQALAARPAGSENLLDPSESYQHWSNTELRGGRESLHTVGARGYHDARAAYACQRYEQLTGHPAPAVAGERQASKEDDRAAREIISAELGHGRIDVLTSYVGSAK